MVDPKKRVCNVSVVIDFVSQRTVLSHEVDEESFWRSANLAGQGSKSESKYAHELDKYTDQRKDRIVV